MGNSLKRFGDNTRKIQVGFGRGEKCMKHQSIKEAKLSGKLPGILRDNRGITGLETAIILIAFVVVASVFAYTVLSAGVFASQKGKEAIYGGLKKVSEVLEPRGSTIAKDTTAPADSKVDQVIFTVALALGNDPVDFTPPTDVASDGEPDAGSAHKTIISYIDERQYLSNLTWTKTLLGFGNSNNLLEANEQFEITVNLAKVATGTNPLGADTTFTLEVKPSHGSVLNITRTTPGSIGAVVQLY
ncbi:MAG: Flagellin FlaB1 [Dehalococcoidia bacterium]|nr:Flagellin FlaB1 [Dehalococcoidia bacterium]MBF8304756.1 Flagellin FlaB1 [Dehalococcoidia bacterium]